MNDLSRRFRVATLAITLGIVASPVVSADPTGETRGRRGEPSRARPLPAMYQPGTTNSGTATSTPPAQPKAGEVGASRNPFHPHTADMLRQSNRLKAKGFSGNVMNDGQIALAMGSAMRLLTQVEADYRGHRAKAIRQVEAAIRLLNTKAAKSVSGPATASKSSRPAASKASMSQAEADEHLRESRKALGKILAYMDGDGNAKRHAPARASLKEAIQELDQALEGR